MAAAVEACDLLLEHCQIVYHDINANSSVIFLGWGKHRWSPLDGEAQRPLATGRRAVADLEAQLQAVTDVAAPERMSRARDVLAPMRCVVNQADDIFGPGYESVDEARIAVRAAATQVLGFVEMLPSAHGVGGRLFVPDTNAVIWQPDLTKWDLGAGTLVMLPTVVSELDHLKTRTGDVSQKAEKAIRVLNEMERRGDTFAGVKLSGRGMLRELAIDPQLPSPPSWMDAAQADDRILAGALRLALEDLDVEVTLVTRDRNMRNKARLAGLAVEDLSELASQD